MKTNNPSYGKLNLDINLEVGITIKGMGTLILGIVMDGKYITKGVSKWRTEVYYIGWWKH